MEGGLNLVLCINHFAALMVKVVVVVVVVVNEGVREENE